MTKHVNLVLEGGGVKGIALVGAVEALEKAGYTFHRIAGTSAGAIVGGLLAAGYTSVELKAIMADMPYEKFRDKSLIDRLGLPGRLISLLFEKGIYEGEFFCKWYGELLQRNGISTFGDVKLEGSAYPDHKNYKFVAVAADISHGKLLPFPWALPDFGLNPDESIIARAVRASISIPFFYEPVKLGESYLVDGGLLSNYSIQLFTDDDIPTIGIKLSAKPGATDMPHKIVGPIDYAKAIITTTLDTQDQIHLNDPKAVSRTIFVDTGKVRATDLNITKDQQNVLYQAGLSAANKYLAKN